MNLLSRLCKEKRPLEGGNEQANRSRNLRVAESKPIGSVDRCANPGGVRIGSGQVSGQPPDGIPGFE